MKPSTHDLSAVAFGTMDGVINVLGILLGVYAATSSRLAVIAAVVAGGVANGIANAAGLHVSKEVDGVRGHGKIFFIMLYGFLATFLTGLVQIVPLFFLPLDVGVYVGAFIGLVLLAILGYMNEKSLHVSLEYVVMGLVGGVLAYSLGALINSVIAG
ncbi:MAG: hypothetical protein QXL47_04230, partial [Candidatus Anstonellales archaeon]